MDSVTDFSKVLHRSFACGTRTENRKNMYLLHLVSLFY